MTRPVGEVRTAAVMVLGGSALAALGTVLAWRVPRYGPAAFPQVGLAIDAGLLALVLALVAGSLGLWLHGRADAPDGVRQFVVACGIGLALLPVFIGVSSLAAGITPGIGLVVTFAGAGLVSVGGWLATAGSPFRGCPRCPAHVAPDALAQHLVRGHGVTPAAAVDEACRV